MDEELEEFFRRYHVWNSKPTSWHRLQELIVALERSYKERLNQDDLDWLGE